METSEKLSRTSQQQSPDCMDDEHNPAKLSDEDIEYELTTLLKEKKDLQSKIDQIDTNIIGLKEEKRRRKEKSRSK